MSRGRVAVECVRRNPTCRRSGPGEVWTSTRAETNAGGLLQLRGRLLVHLTIHWHLHALRTRHRQPCLHLELADRRPWPAPRRAELCRGELAFPSGGLGLSMDQVPLEQALC